MRQAVAVYALQNSCDAIGEKLYFGLLVVKSMVAHECDVFSVLAGCGREYQATR